MVLILCTGCRRHVRETDAACPFCGTNVAGAAALGSAPFPPGMSRAQMYALGAATALGVACGGANATRPDGTVIDVASPDAGSSMPIATGSPTSTAPPFVTAQPTSTVRQPPNDDPSDPVNDPRRRNWRKNRPPNAPYGCVFPD